MVASHDSSGEREYLLESWHFQRDSDSNISVSQAARLTASFVARYATNLTAWLTTDASTRRHYLLPRNQKSRQKTADAVYAEIEALASTVQGVASGPSAALVGLELRRDGTVLLDQHDGAPAPSLRLVPAQFQRLQKWWRQHCIPDDLYYPATELSTVVLPTERYGGVVLSPQQLSPRQFDAYVTGGTQTLVVPTQEERDAQWMLACREFVRAALLRADQLREPGKSLDARELSELDDMIQAVGAVIVRQMAAAQTSG